MLLQMVNEHTHFITLLTVLGIIMHLITFSVKMLKVVVHCSVLFSYWQGLTFSNYQHFYLFLSKKLFLMFSSFRLVLINLMDRQSFFRIQSGTQHLTYRYYVRTLWESFGPAGVC